MTTVVLTGGAGNVGRLLRPHLAPRVGALRILDLADPGALAANESWSRTDIADLAALTAALQGADAVIHLAGYPNERALEEILRVNVQGASNLYEAARLAGVGRVVLGSSNHATGFYPRAQRVSPGMPMRPDGLYGLSKCWAELTAGLYFDKAGIRSLIIRIGNAFERPITPRSLKIWISARDLAELIWIGLTSPEVGCTTVYGTSGGGGQWWDTSAAAALGFQARDRTLDFATPQALAPAEADPSAIAEHFQGGPFCADGHDGTLRDR